MIPLSTLLTRTRARYETAAGGSTTRFTDAILTDYVNEGLETLAESTGFYERYCTIPVEENRIYYDVRGFTNETVLNVKSVWSSAFEDFLNQTNPEELGSTWEENVGGPPVRWWTRGIYWIVIHPIPDATSGFLRVKFSGIPARMTFSQYVLGDLPDRYYPALEDYVLYEMAGADKQPKRAVQHFASYLQREKSLGDLVSRRLVDSSCGAIGRYAGRR
jgi:hypothetical protein